MASGGPQASSSKQPSLSKKPNANKAPKSEREAIKAKEVKANESTMKQKTALEPDMGTTPKQNPQQPEEEEEGLQNSPIKIERNEEGTPISQPKMIIRQLAKMKPKSKKWRNRKHCPSMAQ